MKSGMPGSSSLAVRSSKNWCRKIIQARSISRGASPTISQSSTATGAKSRYSMLPMRESPQLSAVGPSSAGQCSSSQAKARSIRGWGRSPDTQR